MKENYKEFFPILNRLRTWRGQQGPAAIDGSLNARDAENRKILRTFAILGILICVSFVVSFVSRFNEGRLGREATRYVKTALKDDGVSAKEFEIVSDYLAYNPDENTGVERRTMLGLRVLERLIGQLENVDDEALAQMPQVIPHVNEGVKAVVKDSTVLSLFSELIDAMMLYSPGDEDCFRRNIKLLRFKIGKMEEDMMPEPVPFYAIAYSVKGTGGSMGRDTAYVAYCVKDGGFDFIEEPERWIPAR